MVPPGYRFKPTDQELMRYLEAFVVGKPLEHTFEFIRVEDLYGGREPREIFDTGSGEAVRYYFTELKRISRTGSRFLRRVGDGGTWKGQERGLSICDNNKTIMGFKKSLRYEGKRSRKERGVDEHGVWLMKEYSLSDDYLRGKKVVRKNFVLCQIKKIVTKTSRNQFNGGQNVHEVDTLEAFEFDDEVTRGMLSTPLPLENSMLDDENRHHSYEVSTQTKININNHHQFQEVLVNNQEMAGTIPSSNIIIDYDSNNNQSGQINHHHPETMVNNQEMASSSSNVIIDCNQSDGLIGAADHHGVIGSNTQMIEGDSILLDDLDDDLLRLLMTEPPVDLNLDDFFFEQ